MDLFKLVNDMKNNQRIIVNCLTEESAKLLFEEFINQRCVRKDNGSMKESMWYVNKSQTCYRIKDSNIVIKGTIHGYRNVIYTLPFNIDEVIWYELGKEEEIIEF